MDGEKLTADERAAAMPSQKITDAMGWERAIAGLRAPGALFLWLVLGFYWQPVRFGLRESCRLAAQEWRRMFPESGAPLSDRQVSTRFGRLDQDMLRSMRECQRN